MEKITDPNPYDILGISPDADRRAIKQALADRQRANRNQVERQQALSARNALVSTEKRLIVDALTPNFTASTEDAAMQANLEDLIEPAEALSLQDFVGFNTVVAQDLEALIDVTIRHTIRIPPAPTRKLELTTEFDGLDEFLAVWLSQP